MKNLDKEIQECEKQAQKLLQRIEELKAKASEEAMYVPDGIPLTINIRGGLKYMGVSNKNILYWHNYADTWIVGLKTSDLYKPKLKMTKTKTLTKGRWYFMDMGTLKNLRDTSSYGLYVGNDEFRCVTSLGNIVVAEVSLGYTYYLIEEA